VTTGQPSCPHQTNLRSLANLDPYPAYRSAAEEAPVHWDDSMGGWVVFGFDACSAVLKDEPGFVMPWTAFEGGQEALGRYGIFNLTGAAQARAHKELLDFFNPRKSPQLQATVERLVEDSFARVKESGQADFINAVARRVPGLMALAFLGVPQDEDVLETVHHANTKLQNYMTSFGDDPQALAELQAVQDGLAELWGPSIEARRRRREPDLISRLLDQQESLADWAPRELISQCLFYFGASFGNTANAIANAAYMLAVDDRWLPELRRRPQTVPVFVDEVLRVWGSVQFRIRIATRDTEIAGQPVGKGDRVIAVVGGANRDDRQFRNADDIDLDRAGTRRHLTFGVGARYCVGATLARLEAEQVVRALVSSAGELRLSTSAEAGSRFAGLNYRVWEPLTVLYTSSRAATGVAE
jgi:cytochrome P450